MAIDSYMVFEISPNPKKLLESESSVKWVDTSLLGGVQKEFIDMKDASDKGAIFEIDSYSFDIEQQLNIGSQSGGTGAGRVQFGEFTIERKIDKSSPQFFMMACNGTSFSRVSLLLRKGGGDTGSGLTFVRFDFRLVGVSKVSWSHDDEAPRESLSLQYGAMKIGYTEQLSTGRMGNLSHGGWNRIENTNDENDTPLGKYAAKA